MISEGSCDTEDWKKFSFAITGINFILIYISTNKSSLNVSWNFASSWSYVWCSKWENSRVLRECEIETYCTQLHCNVLFQIYSLVVTYLFR